VHGYRLVLLPKPLHRSRFLHVLFNLRSIATCRVAERLLNDGPALFDLATLA